MAWLAVNRYGEELIFENEPEYDRVEDTWKVLGIREELMYDDPNDYSAGVHTGAVSDDDYGIKLPEGTIEKLISGPLSLANNPVEIK